MIANLSKANDKKHKYKVVIENNGKKKTLKFGAYGYEDFTSHKDEERKKRYIKRHEGMGEDWGKSGIMTKGFWSRWLLWGNSSNLNEAIKDIEKRFNITIKNV